MDFFKQFPLALILKVVNRQAGHHGVEGSHICKRKRQVVSAELHQWVGFESAGGASEHRLGSVNPHRQCVGVMLANCSK